jgi:hypothetical protein
MQFDTAMKASNKGRAGEGPNGNAKKIFTLGCKIAKYLFYGPHIQYISGGPYKLKKNKLLKD